MPSSRTTFVVALAVALAIPAVASAQFGRGGVLALRVDDDATPLLGAEDGGEARPRAGRPTGLPLTVRGGADALSGLVDKLAKGRRFGGELVLTRGRARQPLLSFDKAYATELTIPAIGGDAGPFALSVKIEPGDADVGPFDSEAAQRGRGAAVWQRLRRAVRRLAPARAELSMDRLGKVRASAVGEVTVTHPRAGALEASAVWVTIDRDDSEDWIEAFEAGRRLGSPKLRYVDRGNDTLLELGGDHARITAARPDYESGDVKLRIELDSPTVRAPSQ